jgi:virulence factor Mce-like protein
MNPQRPTRRLGAPNELLLGAVAILVAAVAVFISYNANNGLPFVPTYRVSVQVPDAAELTKGDDVRIGGERVGVVLAITAIPAGARGAPHAQVKLALDARTGHLPVDTQVQIRPASILGAKYVAIVPGHAARRVPQNGALPLAQARPVVEINDFLGTFDAATRAAIQGTVGGLGDAFAGRGEALNAAIGSTAQLLGPLTDVSRTLAAPGTDLAGFIAGADATFGALEPVAPGLGSLVDDLDTTLAALDTAGASLGATIDQLPGTEAQATGTLRDALPVLADATALTRGLRAGSALLPTAATRLDAAVRAGTAVLRPAAGVPRVGAALADTLARLAGQADPLAGDLRQLTPTVTTLGSTLTFLNPSQTVCNAAGIWARNIDSSLSQGDASGGWFRGLMMFNTPGLMQVPAPEANLHTNPYANENASECEAGNEPYLPGRQIGNPPGNQSTHVDETAPPPDATARAQAAGLLAPTPGAHP